MPRDRWDIIEGVWGDDVDDENDIFHKIARFEDAVDDGRQAWLGRGPGLALGIGLAVVVVLAAPVVWIGPVLVTRSPLFHKACGAAWALSAMFGMAYWRRQRLAAHFEAAHRRLASADPAERQRALIDLMINARRGRAEHGRIAQDLAAYLRRPPLDGADEAGRRQIAFTMLAEQTLIVAVKQRLDLSGAMLAGIRGVDAELPGVRLHGADLTGARLRRANLEGADLTGARLEGADLTGARLGGAILPPPAEGSKA